MKNYKIQPLVVVAVIFVTVFIFYASHPWPHEITGGQNPATLRTLRGRLHWFLYPPTDPHANRIAISSRRDPVTGQWHKTLAIMDSKGQYTDVTPATLPKLPRQKRAHVESFVKSQGFPSLEAYLSADTMDSHLVPTRNPAKDTLRSGR